MLAKKLHQNFFSLLQPNFFFDKQMKIGVEDFSEKPSTPIFFICSYFIGAG